MNNTHNEEMFKSTSFSFTHTHTHTHSHTHTHTHVMSFSLIQALQYKNVK